MVTGPLRVVLWVLGGLAVVWLILGLAMLPAMGRMMGGGMTQGGMMDGAAMGEGMMCCGGGMMGMMGLMAIQLIAMLGLVGVFIYLVVDAVRRRSSPIGS
jgi:hypothetical protein